MAEFSWRLFLQRWSRATLASPDIEHFNLPPEVISSRWLGYAPATEEQMVSAEERLGARLPPSYRAFLKASNGWHHTGNFVDRILPVEEIQWVRDLPPKWRANVIDPSVEQMVGFNDDGEQDVADYAHLPDTLLISTDAGEEHFLLNPRVVNSDGEWQAWTVAHWIPGIDSNESFRLLAERELETLLAYADKELQRVKPTDSPDTVTAKLARLIADLEAKAARYPQGDDFSRGTVQGLMEVAARLRVLPADETLREQVRVVANEFEARHRVQQGSQADALDWRALLSPHRLGDSLEQMNRTKQLVVEYGQAEGYRQGAASIRWWLDEE